MTSGLVMITRVDRDPTDAVLAGTEGVFLAGLAQRVSVCKHEGATLAHSCSCLRTMRVKQAMDTNAVRVIE